MFLAIIMVGTVLAISVGAVADRKQPDGMLYWAAGLGLHTLAYILFSLRGQVPDLVSIVLANSFLSCAVAAFTEGLYAFYRINAPRRRIWLPVAIVFITFLALLDQLSARIAVGAMIFVVQCCMALLFMWSQRRQTTGRGQYFLAAGIAVMTALLLVRVVGAFSGATSAMMSLTQNSLIQTLTFLGGLVSLLLLGIGFVLMSKERADQLNQVLATHDDLTGIANRRRFNEVLAIEWARANRSGQSLALAMIDIDQFKDYNDLYGHQAGDGCLKRVAQAIQAAAQRAGDLAARYGGEEFVLILPDADVSAAQRVTENLRKHIESLALPHAGVRSNRVTVSIGVAALNKDCFPDAESLLHAADTALYRAKHEGRNQVRIAPESLNAQSERTGVSAKLVQLVWRSVYESGNPVIDAQHRELFNDVNQLLGSMLGEGQIDNVAALVRVFISDVTQHFEDEEAIIKAAGFPGAESHAQLHRTLVDKAHRLADHFARGTLSLGELFEYLAHDLVARHMLIVDRNFFPYLQPRSDASLVGI